MDVLALASRIRERLAMPDADLHAQVAELLQGLGSDATGVWDAARPPQPTINWLTEIEALAAASSELSARSLSGLLMARAPLVECAAFWMGARDKLHGDDFFQQCGRPRPAGGLPLEWATLPGGVFRMGSRDSGTDSWEHPSHAVSLQPFSITTTPITRTQMARMERHRPAGNAPAGSVTWLEAWLFAEWAGAALPTEAQWEYACRAGSDAPWSSGYHPERLTQVAWFQDNANGTPHPVQRKAPNDWGVYDMHGNVLEWCADRQRAYYANASPLRDPGQDAQTDHVSVRGAVFRVVRGGYYGSSAQECRSARRSVFDVLSAFDGLGFRLVSAEPPPQTEARAPAGSEEPGSEETAPTG